MGRSCSDALVGTVDTVVLVDRDADLLATAGHELAARPVRTSRSSSPT
jgi:hypothetical protein